MANDNSSGRLRLAIAGLGAIGFAVARHVDQGGVEDLWLAAVASGNRAKAEGRLSEFTRPPPVVPLDELAEHANVVVECAPARIFAALARSTLERGRIFMPLSVGQLLDNLDLVDLARAHGGRIVVPTGALLGLDALRATAVGTIDSVTMETRKPPAGLKGAPYLVENGICVDGLDEAKLLFAGPAREAAKGFPANLNVAAALALAGIGPDRTQVEIWADPGVTRNTHTIRVVSDSSNLTMTIENIPTQENPRTGRITALSVIAALRRLTDPLTIGT